MAISYKYNGEKKRGIGRKVNQDTEDGGSPGHFTGGMAHDFNNLLTAPLGWCRDYLSMTQEV